MNAYPLAGGTVQRHSFQSNTILPRFIDVWCPPDYAVSERAYPVIYMHDGQNLFDPAWAYIGVDWGVDEAMVRLIGAGVTPGAIIVGIWSTEQRRREYMPQSMLNGPNAAVLQQIAIERAGGPLLSDAYSAALVDEIKPMIDTTYRTLPQRQHTFVMGSSMGGLISLYLICQYPHVFGGAACVSTHWPAGGSLLVQHMATLLPDPQTHRIYFDYGTATFDAEYEPFQQEMDGLMWARGYTEATWMTRRFEGAEHSERSWRERVDIPLRFLLAPDSLKDAP